MPKRRKTAEIEALILKLLKNEPEVSIRSIATAAEVSKDNETERKAIQRALHSLEEQKVIIPKGAGRSRVYVLFDKTPQKEQSSEADTESGSFKGIELSPESTSLLQYVSQGTNERALVGYNQEFLRSYEPDK